MKKPKEINIIQRNVPHELFVELIKQSPTGEIVAKNHWGSRQMTHFQAGEMVAHTELENEKVVAGKFLITSIVRPLTEELRESIKNKDHGTITQQNS